MDLATAYVQIVPTSKGMNKNLTNLLDGQAESAGKSAGNKFTSALGSVAKVGGAAALAAGGAFVALTTNAMSAAGELEQNLGGSEAVFQQYADKIQNVAKTAFSEMGLSQSDFLANANKMGSLLQGSGFGVEEAMNTSVEVMQRAADVASIMGIDLSSAMEAVSGAAKGNFTMMDNLGVAINDTTLKAYAQEKGLGNLVTTQDKVSAAMQLFMEKTANYAGNYAKENETYAGSISTLQAAWSNFLSGAGGAEEVAQSFKNVAEVIGSMLEELIPRLAEGLPDMIMSLVDSVIPIIESTLPSLIDAVVNLLMGLVDRLPEFINSIVSALNTALPALIQGATQLVMGIVNALPDIIVSLIDSLPMIIETVIEGLIGCIPQLVVGCIELVIGLVEHLPEIIIGLVKAQPMIIDAIIDAILGCGPKFVECAQGLIEKFKEGWERIKEVGANIVEGLWNGIGRKVEWLKEKIKGFCSSALGAIKKFFGIASPSKVMRDEIGKYLPEGMAVGIEANADSALNAMHNLTRNLTGEASMTMNRELATTESSGGSSDLYNLLATYLPMIAQGGNVTIEGDMGKLFTALRKENSQYQNQHNGRSAFA